MVGSLRGKTEILFPERQLKWARNVVKALGIYFSINEARQLNFAEKNEKIKKKRPRIGT